MNLSRIPSGGSKSERFAAEWWTRDADVLWIYTSAGRDGNPTLSGSKEILGVDSFNSPLEPYSETLLRKLATISRDPYLDVCEHVLMYSLCILFKFRISFKRSAHSAGPLSKLRGLVNLFFISLVGFADFVILEHWGLRLRRSMTQRGEQRQ